MKTKPRIIIYCDGGLVQGVLSDIDLDVTVLDYDVEGATEEDLQEIPQDGDHYALGSLSSHTAEICPNRITEILNSPLHK